MKKGERKQFCINGHDTFKCGRYPEGHCKKCRPYVPHPKDTRFCPKGHDKDIVGRMKGGACKKCRKEYRIKYTIELKRKKRKIKHIKQNCVNGHSIDVFGRDITGHCNECQRIYESKHNKEYQKKNRNKLTRLRKIRQIFDIQFKLTCYLRSRLKSAIKNNQKTGSAIADLGCSIDFLKTYIESKFYAGMTWDNWGSVWELDHKIALMFFDLTDRKQLLKAVNYKNLQPLTIPDHRKKTAIEIAISRKRRKSMPVHKKGSDEKLVVIEVEVTKEGKVKIKGKPVKQVKKA